MVFTVFDFRLYIGQALEVQSQLDTSKFSEDEKKEAFTYQKSFLKELVSDETQSYTTDEVRSQLAHAQKLADPTDDQKILHETSSMITVLAVRDKGLNDPVEFTLDERMSSVKIIKTKLNEEITTKGANFQFPSELQERFSNWACDDKQDCEGVVLSMTTYNAVNNTFVGDTRRQCSDIIELDLVNPVSGEIKEVIGLKEPIEMELPVTKSCNLGTNTKTKCYYYDSVTKEFKSDGLTTNSVSASTISCTTSHLTAFTLRNELAVVEQLNKAIILGAVFGGVVLTAIVIVIVLLIVKKKSKHESKSRPNMKNHTKSLLKQIRQSKKKVEFIWIPSHVQILGNEKANAEARNKLDDPMVQNIKTVKYCT
ncbi:hypothetical protein CHS0354_031874 [Potamilus streckersoni]|uniref:RNase H type-1 domain-containing protein n=1 Tax=Potamilus streckersoni TaxID=2493646 RepID=A0AAE0RXM4_9BIVA|nr:hypothetical protein CHS0354_031874 [Potamilus streckersoni]